MARGVPLVYSDQPPSIGPWLLYSQSIESSWPLDRCLAIAHSPESWRFFEGSTDIESTDNIDGLVTVFPERVAGYELSYDLPFDIIANAFYFLCSWSERFKRNKVRTRSMYTDSIFVKFDVPQDIVDQYLDRLIRLLQKLCDRLEIAKWNSFDWPQGTTHALILSHDVDFVPAGLIDILKQGTKSILRHLIRQRDPVDAFYAANGLLNAFIHKRDPYGCLPEIIKREKEFGVNASFQVAVGHRHVNDVNYFIENDQTRDYLKCIVNADFDLCLHGSYRSTENPSWYKEEAALLAKRLCKPLGSRQHFLSFDYDSLFSAQEQAGIEYDMSMGYPDATGPRAGFSYPYFPYCLKLDRPYKVLQFSLFLMDVTLRSYMSLKGEKAWDSIKATLDVVSNKGGCVSVVWHPIVFGGARDPGYDNLFWRMIKYTQDNGGLATDGRTINKFWRNLAKNYTSFN
jgi:hypothetical protein